ncbi:uncharacterized protein ARMOST_20000 [Armillaria ostoyae]|uniref:Uncharacterized protein n=1 Tax=Armillaria ostoyae TaxID=47428 RepID=A0A284S631_ARMOS|nr:uncharacterized protein ARMOST_20000 [Armillaria ostoyae]
MSTPQAPAAAPATGGVQQEESGFRKFSGFAQQIFSFWAIMQVATKFFAPKTAGLDAAVSTGGKPVVNTQPVNPWSQPPTHASLVWPLGETYSMQVYFTMTPHTDNKENNLPHSVWDNIKFGD